MSGGSLKQVLSVHTDCVKAITNAIKIFFLHIHSYLTESEQY